jgi:VWFA-related protein
MSINPRLDLFLLVSLLCPPEISARQNHSAAHPGERIYLDVAVSSAAGSPVSGLLQQDFTILDNNVPQTITSFEAVDGRHAPAEVIIVIDAVNIGEREVAIEREEIKKFLKAEGGHLAYPTRVALVTDKGLLLPGGLSQDGSAISSTLDHNKIPLRSLGRDADHGAAADRFQISFQAFAQLIADARDKRGRKLILWVSPGWPPLLGLENTRDARLKEQVFGNRVEISTQLREGQITVYSVDPSGIVDIDPGLTDPPTNHLRPSDRKVYIEGAREPRDVRTGHLTLRVLAAQSGGLVLNPGNDLARELQKCVADALAYYEISFDPVISDRPNEYHHLEIRVAKPGLTARTRQEYYSQPWPVEKFAAASQSLAGDTNTQTDPAHVHSYFDEPLAQLVERIPRLKGLQPVPAQHEVSVILQKMGRSVDDFVRDVGDLIANEDVTQEKLNANGTIRAKERVQDSYLVLHHGYEWGASAEYRMDEKGNRLGPIGLEKGYLVTSGHALSCISFSTLAQAQSKFRYLGEEKIDSRETYVMGFAQQPGVATFTTTMTGTGGPDVDMLTQGILWVDKNSFQIVRMRSDLLAPNNEIRIDHLTTEVSFREVQLQDVPNALWLPSDVDVYIEIGKQKFHNIHRYTNYRRYRVSVKVGDPR